MVAHAGDQQQGAGDLMQATSCRRPSRRSGRPHAGDLMQATIMEERATSCWGRSLIATSATVIWTDHHRGSFYCWGRPLLIATSATVIWATSFSAGRPS
jgi:hypothetical protein